MERLEDKDGKRARTNAWRDHVRECVSACVRACARTCMVYVEEGSLTLAFVRVLSGELAGA